MGVDNPMVTSLVYWIPCGQVNFFHLADDLELASAGTPWMPLGGSGMERCLELRELDCTGSSSLFQRVMDLGHRTGAKQAIIENAQDPRWAEIQWPKGRRLKVHAAGTHLWTAGTDETTADLHDFVRQAVHLDDTYATPIAAGRGGPADGSITLPLAYSSYLCFFQLNLLLGGLASRSLAPGVFLEVEDRADERASWARIEQIIESVWVEDPDASDAAAAAIERFLRVTQERSLQKAKWRMERARRALLSSMLGIVHRRRPLVQLREALHYPEDFSRANDPQLRGYIMLVSAKLPLIKAVARYAEEARDYLGPGHHGATIQRLELRLQSWERLVAVIEENVAGLESALQHAWMERLLYEQEQMRAEQEALAEIERSRVRERSATTTVDSLFAAAVLIVTIAAFLATGGSARQADLRQEVILIGAGLLSAFVLWGAFRVHLWNRRRIAVDQRHTYEVNLRFDCPIEAEAVASIRSLGERVGGPNRRGPRSPGIARGSLRVERISGDDALFKFHVESRAELPTADGPRRRRRRYLKIFSVYEILFHSPGEAGEYLFRELRVIVHTERTLSSRELLWLNEEIARSLVDPFVADDESLIDRIRAHEEAATAALTA